MDDLAMKHCEACEGGIPPLEDERIAELMTRVNGWQLRSDQKEISKSFSFKNFHHTMAFLNAVAWMAHREDHHPDIEAGYNYCVLRYSTHAISALSENDFVCAAKVDKLFD